MRYKGVKKKYHKDDKITANLTIKGTIFTKPGIP